MKISASIYSQKGTPLEEVIKDLDTHRIDFFHIDCEDDLAVFKDIETIRRLSKTPIDLHIITDSPEKYWDAIVENKIEFVTFQHENLKAKLVVPKTIQAKIGIAITSDTSVEIFSDYKDIADFILIMATTPGKSGGTFNVNNFRKIRQFKQRFPTKKLHVDGGVNGEVSFILRNLGVDASVSGSFLFNAENIGFALLNLKIFENESHYCIRDFMMELEEIAVLNEDELDFYSVLDKIEKYKLGFVAIVNNQSQLKGIISNADVRRGLLQFKRISNDDLVHYINHHPTTVKEKQTVVELLQIIKSKTFPVSYLPVINESGQITGAVTFINLVKGEA